MERITVNMVPGGPLEICHASQFDLGREIAFDLMDGKTAFTLDGTETVTLKISKPDGTSVEDAVPNTSDSYVIWTSSDGDCDVSGVSECEISVTKGGDLLGSGNFLMLVEADAYNGTNIRTLSVGPADICTFETTLPEPYQSVLVNVLATGGNGTPDNPIPIVGYSSANITRCGVNLCEEVFEDGYIDSSGNESSYVYAIRSKNYNLCKPSTNYYYVHPYALPGFQICWYDNNKTFIRRDTDTNDLTSPNNACYFRISYYNYKQQFPSYADNLGINYPATDTTYHAYNGQTYTIAFGQTVYGGVLDVTRGKLRVTWGSVDLGTLSWTHRTDVAQGVFAAQLSDYNFIATVQGKCDIYSYDGTTVVSQVPSHGNNTITLYYDAQQTARVVYVYDTAYSDANAFKSAVNGHIFIYELATPFDIDLTPAQIRALVGQNNVFADCGQTEVEYLDKE